MKYQRGFTILEVILFLAISGALTASLLVGVGVAVQRQQYREAIQSYAGFVRDQYSQVINVQNDREHGSSCPITGVDSAVTTPSRGQSNCVILGRYVETADNDGSRYRAYPVYGAFNGSDWEYGLGDEDAKYDVQWSSKTRLKDQLDGNTGISILMYRHPEMGNLVIRMDTNSYNNSNIGSFISSIDNSLTSQREVCVYSPGWLPSARNSISIGAKAGSSDSVTVINSSSGCND